MWTVWIQIGSEYHSNLHVLLLLLVVCVLLCQYVYHIVVLYVLSTFVYVNLHVIVHVRFCILRTCFIYELQINKVTVKVAESLQ